MSANELHHGVWARLDYVEQRKQTAALVWLREHHIVFHITELKVLYTERAAKYGYSTEFRHDIDPSVWSPLTKKQRYPQYEAKKWLMDHHVLYHPDDFRMLFTERAAKYGYVPTHKTNKTNYDDIDVNLWASLTSEQRSAERHAYLWLLDHHIPFHILDYFIVYSERAKRFGRVTHKRKHQLPSSKRRKFVIQPTTEPDVAEPDLWLDGFEGTFE